MRERERESVLLPHLLSLLSFAHTLTHSLRTLTHTHALFMSETVALREQSRVAGAVVTEEEKQRR